MKISSTILAALAFLTGLRAAYLWYRASRVQIIPMWAVGDSLEPVDPAQAQAEWTVAMLDTATKSGQLNQRGAIWTAIAVALSTASTLIGSLQ